MGIREKSVDPAFDGRLEAFERIDPVLAKVQKAMVAYSEALARLCDAGGELAGALGEFYDVTYTTDLSDRLAESGAGSTRQLFAH